MATIGKTDRNQNLIKFQNTNKRDGAYHVRQIREQTQVLEHVAIMDRNPRRCEALPMSPHEAQQRDLTVAGKKNSEVEM
jgi:hypothetical protein